MKFKNQYIIITIILSTLLSFHINCYAQSDGDQLADKLYIDPKGYFKIRPPNGWSISEYSSDPRGKVDFNSSNSSVKAQLKIIGAS